MDKVIKSWIGQILIPVMEKHGFIYSFESNTCYFEKKSRDGMRTQRIFVSEFKETCKYIKMEISVSPTFLHSPILNPKDIIIKNGYKVKEYCGGWIYKTAEEAEIIIKMITESMKKKGFLFLDDIMNDPDDLYPTLLEHRDIYENHEKYLKVFKERYDFTTDDIEKALKVLQKSVDDFPERITEENRAQLMPIVAAYGEIFVSIGGKWNWNEKIDRSMVLIPVQDSSINDIMIPLDEVYSAIQSKRKYRIYDAILEELKFSGNL